MKRLALSLSLLPALLPCSAQADLAASARSVRGDTLSLCLPLAWRSNSVYSQFEAAAVGDASVLEARLAEGEDPNQRDELGSCPLHYAVRGESARVLTLLLEAGADPSARDADGRTPRELCCHADFLPILQEAEQRRERELALSALVARGDEAGVRAALAGGVNPNARSADNKGSILLHAVAEGHQGIVSALLAAGAEVNAVAAQGKLSALHYAAARGNVALIRILLKAKANPMLQGANGAYPLHDAIWARQLEAVRALLPAYAHLNFSPKGGPHGSPLSMAISYGRVEVVRAFLEAGFNPNDLRLRDEPPLILAVRSGQDACVRLLLEAGADTQMTDARGKTAADYAPASLAPLLR